MDPELWTPISHALCSSGIPLSNFANERQSAGAAKVNIDPARNVQLPDRAHHGNLCMRFGKLPCLMRDPSVLQTITLGFCCLNSPPFALGAAFCAKTNLQPSATTFLHTTPTEPKMPTVPA